ncbi:Ltp family lipoprotein [Arthrobacter pigmenti]
MKNNTPSPNGQPWEQHPRGQKSPEGAKEKVARPWFKKKRAIIPAGILALFIISGIASCGNEDPEPVGSDQTSEVEATTSAGDTSAADEAKASAKAEEEADKKAEAEAKAKEEAEAKAAEEAEAAAKAEAEAKAAEEAEAAAKAEAEAKAAEEAEAAKAKAEAGTVSQQNALRAAENYLDFTAFSRTGLIDQLVFEEYSAEDATWAVDRVNVDWNEQAAKAAANYLDFTSFSRQGLIDQLIFEGYTPAQAQYGVSQTGL